MGIETVQVGDIAEQIRGVSYKKADATREQSPGYVPILRANNIGADGLKLDDLVYVPNEKVSEKQRLRIGDVVVAASSGSIDVVGKAAAVTSAFDGSFGAFCKVVRPGPRIHASYLAHYFRTPTYRREVSALAAGININNLRNEHLDELKILLPPIEEQKRIAEILDQVHELRAARQQSLGRLSELGQSIFYEMFGSLLEEGPADCTLGDVAEIVSGITKGRKLNGKRTRTVPYLAVVNVQDRNLRLEPLKVIEATEDEISRYFLQKDDLLLTEGGDPDKLGRGTLWNNEIPECIHQNHVFRVRLREDSVDPTFLNWLVGSHHGKRYFLRSAKQTTGIASINMKQLRSFPLLIPPKTQQRKFANCINRIEAHRLALLEHRNKLDRLISSMQHRAFRGEL